MRIHRSSMPFEYTVRIDELKALFSIEVQRMKGRVAATPWHHRHPVYKSNNKLIY